MIDLILDYALKFAGIGFAYFALHRVVSKKSKRNSHSYWIYWIRFRLLILQRLSAENRRREII